MPEITDRLADALRGWHPGPSANDALLAAARAADPAFATPPPKTRAELVRKELGEGWIVETRHDDHPSGVEITVYRHHVGMVLIVYRASTLTPEQIAAICRAAVGERSLPGPDPEERAALMDLVRAADRCVRAAGRGTANLDDAFLALPASVREEAGL